jgi:hypothetical protein
MSIAWPRKTRALRHHHFDSTIWNDLRFRDDDIVIATYAKAALKRDMVGEMRRIAAFLDIAIDPARRWREVPTAEESAEYERRAVAELGADCARWLATGEGLA